MSLPATPFSLRDRRALPRGTDERRKRRRRALFWFWASPERRFYTTALGIGLLLLVWAGGLALSAQSQALRAGGLSAEWRLPSLDDISLPGRPVMIALVPFGTTTTVTSSQVVDGWMTVNKDDEVIARARLAPGDLERDLALRVTGNLPRIIAPPVPVPGFQPLRLIELDGILVQTGQEVEWRGKPVEVRVAIRPIDLQKARGDASRLLLFHYDPLLAVWEDTRARVEGAYLVGTVMSLSPFAVGIVEEPGPQSGVLGLRAPTPTPRPTNTPSAAEVAATAQAIATADAAATAVSAAQLTPTATPAPTFGTPPAGPLPGGSATNGPAGSGTPPAATGSGTPGASEPAVGGEPGATDAGGSPVGPAAPDVVPVPPADGVAPPIAPTLAGTPALSPFGSPTVPPRLATIAPLVTPVPTGLVASPTAVVDQQATPTPTAPPGSSPDNVPGIPATQIAAVEITLPPATPPPPATALPGATATATSPPPPAATATATVTPLPTFTPAPTPVPVVTFMSPGGATVPRLFTARMKPGDQASADVAVQNSSGVGVTYTLSTTPTSSTPLDADAAQGLQMVVRRCGASFTVCPVMVYTGPLVATNIPMGGPNTVGTAPPQPGVGIAGADYLRIEVTFPSSAGNSFKQLQSVVTFSWTATQAP